MKRIKTLYARLDSYVRCILIGSLAVALASLLCSAWFSAAAPGSGQYLYFLALQQGYWEAAWVSLLAGGISAALCQAILWEQARQ